MNAALYRDGLRNEVSGVSWVPIRYREFHDIPRIFLAEHRGHIYLFDCSFDENADEYPDRYRVFRLPHGVTPPAEGASWIGLAEGGAFIAEVPISAVEFDPTRRAAVDAAVFDRLSPPTQPSR